MINDRPPGPRGQPPSPMRTTPQREQTQYKPTENPYSSAESLVGGQPIHKKDVSTWSMSRENYKKFLADVK